MSHPFLLFCPYLPMNTKITFADWELGSLRCFEDRWANPEFKSQTTRFLSKFVGPDNEPIANPALLCRKDEQLDGQQPPENEFEALRLSLPFAFVDSNPRYDKGQWWQYVTADNAELYGWPIDVEEGHVTLSRGFLVSVITGGYTISDPKLVLRPPLDLQMTGRSADADPAVLTSIYETVLKSLSCPGANRTADQVRVAVTWFEKAWLNSVTLHSPERLVFLKTAFEALTGESDKPTHAEESARRLRKIFEKVPDATEEHSEVLLWSPAEQGQTRHSQRWVTNGKCKTDLETWFLEFSNVRNAIIHDGEIEQAELRYPRPTNEYEPITYRADYHGPFFHTAEYLLRGAIKVLLSTELSYEIALRSRSFLDYFTEEQSRRDAKPI